MSLRSKNKQNQKLEPLPIVKPSMPKDIWAHTHPNERGLGFIPQDHSEENCYCMGTILYDRKNKTIPNIIQLSETQIINGDVNGNYPPLPDINKELVDLYQSHPELKNWNANNADAWIQTYTGKKFNIFNPKLEDICIEDIAHALSMICRFTGHSHLFYSVAQHSVLVSYICDKANSFYGLMHDQTEAYLGDISRPLKRTAVFQPYRDYEKKLHEIMCFKFGLQAEEPTDVKWADTKLLATEARDLMSPLHPEWKSQFTPLPFKINPLPPKEAKELFLARFNELYKAA